MLVAGCSPASNDPAVAVWSEAATEGVEGGVISMSGDPLELMDKYEDSYFSYDGDWSELEDEWNNHRVNKTLHCLLERGTGGRKEIFSVPPQIRHIFSGRGEELNRQPHAPCAHVREYHTCAQGEGDRGIPPPPGRENLVPS